MPQIPNNANPDPTQVATPDVSNGVDPPSYSNGSLGYTSEPDDSITDAPSGPCLDQGRGLCGRRRRLIHREFRLPAIYSTSEMVGTCRLEVCSNLTSVDSIIDLESKYGNTRSGFSFRLSLREQVADP